MIEDKDKTLEYILQETLEIENTTHCFFIKAYDLEANIFYGRLDITQGLAEQLDDHCEQCFNETIGWIAFRGDGKLCHKWLGGIIGLKKYNHFKDLDQLNKIMGGNNFGSPEIIDVIK